MGDRGFTLIELLVALAVVGILATIVLPGYMSSINRSRRAECRAALVIALQNEERYFTTNNGYDALATIGTPGYSGNSASSAACTLSAHEGNTHNVQGLLSGPKGSVVVLAVPQGWVDSQCLAASYALDSTGNFAPLDASGAVLGSTPAGCF